jgi:hypothetical protein
MGCVIFQKNHFFENFFWKTGKFGAVFGRCEGENGLTTLRPQSRELQKA